MSILRVLLAILRWGTGSVLRVRTQHALQEFGTTKGGWDGVESDIRALMREWVILLVDGLFTTFERAILEAIYLLRKSRMQIAVTHQGVWKVDHLSTDCCLAGHVLHLSVVVLTTSA